MNEIMAKLYELTRNIQRNKAHVTMNFLPHRLFAPVNELYTCYTHVLGHTNRCIKSQVKVFFLKYIPSAISMKKSSSYEKHPGESSAPAV